MRGRGVFHLDVSIIVASWNAAVFLPRAIASATAQRGVSVEVIVCDDASDDDTEKLMIGIADPNVRYIRLEHNSGPSAARNAGLAVARGEWILILDADDTMQPDRACALVRAGRRTGADIVADNMRLVTETGDPLRLLLDEALDESEERIDLEGYILRNLSGQHGLGYLKPVFRRHFLDSHHIRYRDDIRIGEDFAIVCDMLTAGAIFLRRRSAGYDYTVHPRSTSHRINLRQLDRMIDYDCEWLAQHGWRLGPGPLRAMRRHLADLRTQRAFSSMVADIKNMRLRSFLASACGNPSALRQFGTPAKARMERLRARFNRLLPARDQRGPAL